MTGRGRWTAARAAVVLPVVVGVLAGAGLLAWRRVDAPPAWCGQVTGVVAAVAGAPADPRDLVATVVDALQGLDVGALLADLPADLARELRPHRADLEVVVASLRRDPTGADLGDRLSPVLVADLAEVGARYLADCGPPT